MVLVNSVAIPTVNNAAVVGTGTGFTTLAYDAASGTSNLVSRDTSGNSYFNSSISGYATTATAAGTTVLTVASAQQQFFTGSTTQTVTMPVTSTLVLGQTFTIVNNSSGVVTVQSSGANTIQAMAANTQIVLTVLSLVSTAAAGWNAVYGPISNTGSSIPSTSTSNQILQSVASGNPVWSTATYPATTTANRILFSSAANVVGQITTANSSVLVTNASGVPSISNTLPSGVGVAASNSGTNATFGITNSASNNNSNARLFVSSGVLTGSASVSSYVQLSAQNGSVGPTTYSMVSESTGQLFTIMSGIPTVSPVVLQTIDLSGNSILVGNSAVRGTISTGLAAGTNGQLTLVGSTSGSSSVTVPTTAGSCNLTLPTTNGTAGQALLSDGGAGTGYTFGSVATQGAQTTWTPGIAFGGGTTGITYTTQTGQYSQVGNVVYFQCNIVLSNKGSSTGVATITGLPVTTSASSSDNAVSINNFGNITLSVTNTLMSAEFSAAGTTLSLQQTNIAGTISSLSDTNFSNTSQIKFSGFYFTT
jgi:hypothetical protein